VVPKARKYLVTFTLGEATRHFRGLLVVALSIGFPVVE
jgi:hypothetical protein